VCGAAAHSDSVKLVVGRENSGAIQIYYEDHGAGVPAVLVHGYLLDGRSWEKQETALLAAGYRVITYERRGFGASSRPSVGYDYDTLAADLAALLEAWLEDFRADLARITIPVLVMQGDQDRIMPPEATGDRLPELLNCARHVVVPDGPHAIIWTHANEVNPALLDFLQDL
jgi:pimeloyl-ACP methyl ester carboxylesterase